MGPEVKECQGRERFATNLEAAAAEITVQFFGKISQPRDADVENLVFLVWCRKSTNESGKMVGSYLLKTLT